MLGFTSTGEINNKAHLLVIFKDIVRDLVGKKMQYVIRFLV